VADLSPTAMQEQRRMARRAAVILLPIEATLMVLSFILLDAHSEAFWPVVLAFFLLPIVWNVWVFGVYRPRLRRMDQPDRHARR
jgi:hypothetical protein